MKVGDLVKFIGFAPTYPVTQEDSNGVGIIIEIHEISGREKRYTVSWPTGTIGNWLYEETLEVVSECR